MRTSPLLRLGVMGVLFLGLLIPLTMLHTLISERTARRDSVTAEVSSEWGGPQVVSGPMLVVPYRYRTTDSTGRTQQVEASISVLPETLNVQGVVEPEERRRSLFSLIVYRAHLKLTGRFGRPDFSRVRPAPEDILWNAATLHLGVAEPRGIARQLELTWAGARHAFVPGIGEIGLFASGVQAPVSGLADPNAQTFDFALDLSVNGSRELHFLPAGKHTTVQLASRWPHPAFTGAPLPDPRRVDDGGFNATWQVPYFGRGFPQQWTTEQRRLDHLKAQADAARFGVRLIQPVDIYQQADRAVKYAVLFIVLTFVIAFLWEVTSGVLVHPIQYVFVGFALCLFYLLLLSISEHWWFDGAYLVAALVTVGLLSWYWSWVMHGSLQGWTMAAALSLLYGYLYLLLRLEDVALLAGSIGLFVMLAAVMFFTRRIDWYALQLGRPGASAP